MQALARSVKWLLRKRLWRKKPWALVVSRPQGQRIEC